MKIIQGDEYKKIVLNVLLRIDEICRANGLRYVLCAGTLLGAVRHQGFIPWDDDIDIQMPREDYKCLRSLIASGDYGLNFLDVETCPDTVYSFGKICDTATILREHNFQPVGGLGAFVDVFPLDVLPADEKRGKAMCREGYNLLRLITHSSRLSYGKTDSAKTNLLRFAAFWIGKLFHTQKLIRFAERRAQRFNGKPTGYLGTVNWERGWLPEECFFPCSEVIFEGHSFPAPADADRALRTEYGDYMQLPPEAARVSDHYYDCWYREEP